MATIEEEFREPDYLLADADVAGRPGFEITVQEAKIDEIESNAIEQNLTGLRNRINQLGVAEPLVQKLGGSRIVIDLPGVQDAADAKRKINKFANLEFRLEAAADDRPSEIDEWMYNGRLVQLNRRVILTGDRVVHAAQGRDPETGLPQVNVRVDSEGGNMIHDATAPNIGRAMAVIFIEHKPIVTVEEVDGERVERHSSRADKRVISLATIQAALPHSFRITGLTARDAQELAFLLRAGALAAPHVHRRGAHGGRHPRRGEHRARHAGRRHRLRPRTDLHGRLLQGLRPGRQRGADAEPSDPGGGDVAARRDADVAGDRGNPAHGGHGGGTPTY